MQTHETYLRASEPRRHSRQETPPTADATAYLNKREAASYVSLSPRTLDAAKARGEMPFYRVGPRKVLFRRADLDRWLSTMRVAVRLPAGAPAANDAATQGAKVVS